MKTDQDISSLDMRDAFFDKVYEIASSDKDVVFLTDDMDAYSLRKFKADMPEQFINIGVAEQNMINVSAGLAMAGKIVFTYGIAPFVTMRCFEQIKVNLCSMNLGVAIVGVGAGFSFGFDGPTHHGIHDLSVMRTLPEITILNPSDALSASASAEIFYETKTPTYIRLDKGTYPYLGEPTNSFFDGFRIVKPVQKVNIVTTGFMTSKSLEVVQFFESKGVKIGLIDVYRIKPIPYEFADEVLNKSQKVFVIEENSVNGGLGTEVIEIAAKENSDTAITKLGVEDKQFISYGSREWFHLSSNLDVHSLCNSVQKYLNMNRD